MIFVLFYSIINWFAFLQQFHPESIATFHGRQIFKNFAEITKDYWFRLTSSSKKVLILVIYLKKRCVHFLFEFSFLGCLAGEPPWGACSYWWKWLY